jgi:hypothetical protein
MRQAAKGKVYFASKIFQPIFGKLQGNSTTQGRMHLFHTHTNIGAGSEPRNFHMWVP